MAALERGDGSTSLSERVKIIKRMVISKGIPDNDLGRKGSTQSMESECSLRGLVWKILLGSIHMDAKLYAQLVGQGASWTDAKIRDDTFRTFRGDEEFRRRVPEDKLYRVNNAFVRLNFPEEADQESGERSGSQGSSEGKGNAEPEGSNGGQKGGGYVQGMTVLCAPLLFVMPEVDAFFCFNSLLTRHMPRYVAANLDGVHEGCALVDRVLAAVDPVLFNYLESKFLTGALYAFPLILSLHACIPPLEEVVKLWDVMFAFGVHLEVLVCVAQVRSAAGLVIAASVSSQQQQQQQQQHARHIAIPRPSTCAFNRTHTGTPGLPALTAWRFFLS
ncbi:unnamed protein product [Discosporangium mesarthrocarpum]